MKTVWQKTPLILGVICVAAGMAGTVVPHQEMKLALAIALAAVSVYLTRLKSSDRILPEADDSAMPEENIHREES